MPDISDYSLIFESIPSAINLTDQNIRLFPRIFLQDSIFDFYPYAELYFLDDRGATIDLINFVEGLEFDLGIEDTGLDTPGTSGQYYMWSENQLLEPILREHFSGTNVFLLISAFYKKNKPQSRAWLNTISNIITEICTTDYELDPTSTFISTTTGVDNWYQTNQKNGLFIQLLSDNAFNQSNPRSPFFSFFNTNGEFYFMSVDEMFAQEPVDYYYMSFNEQTSIDKFAIQDYTIMYGGLPINFNNYKQNIISIKGDGSYNEEEVKYEDFVYRENIADKLLLRRDYQELSNTINFGLNETTVDSFNIKGRTNSLYRDSILPNRMRVTIHFNPYAVSGKVIDLKVGSFSEDKANMLLEFSGKWLIMKSMHFMGEDGMAYTNLQIAKSTMFVDSNHVFRNDFL